MKVLNSNKRTVIAVIALLIGVCNVIADCTTALQYGTTTPPPGQHQVCMAVPCVGTNCHPSSASCCYDYQWSASVTPTTCYDGGVHNGSNCDPDTTDVTVTGELGIPECGTPCPSNGLGSCIDMRPVDPQNLTIETDFVEFCGEF